MTKILDNLDDLFQDGGFFDDYLAHYGRSVRDGAPVGSGRYPWGSGSEEEQRAVRFRDEVMNLRRQGMSDADIAAKYELKNATELKRRYSIATNTVKQLNIGRYLALKNSDHHYSRSEIGQMLGVNESTLRSWEKDLEGERASKTEKLANTIQEDIDKRGFVDVGKGVDTQLGVSRDRLDTAILMLQDKGYKYQTFKIKQVGNGEDMEIRVLGKPEITQGYIKDHPLEFGPPGFYSEGGEIKRFEKPVSIDSSRVFIRYAEDGGVEKDGLIELRRGVDDISLKDAHYAQVRIAVDGTHYLKGMAMPSDDIPKGYDIVFNTNKHKGTPMINYDDPDHQVLKKMKDPSKTPDGNPFGASIRLDNQLILAQRHYKDKDGNEKLSAINIVSEEGNWETWSKTLPSQFLSKQPLTLAKRQLDLNYADQAREYDQIMKLTNPVVKQKLLQEFADNCDSAAVHLKAAAMSRQQAHVILPFPELKDTEVYAPGYRNGEKVVLIRYPHAGRFELAELTVNNKVESVRKALGTNPRDAIGINPATAGILSGADFDGDTAVVIPNNKGQIKVFDHKGNPDSPLAKLKTFDPKEAYPYVEGMKVMSKANKGKEMGKVTNLITDMTLQGATPDELARAVRHSMVIIDAEKHKLNYKKSEADNQIDALRRKYQYNEATGTYGGSGTLISRAKSPEYVDDRKVLWSLKDENGKKLVDQGIDVKTGEKVYQPAGARGTKRVVNKETGEVTWEKVVKKIQSTKMAEAKDARELLSSTKHPYEMEVVYADYANRMKALANRARKSYLATPSQKQSASAKETYKEERASLLAKLNDALKNKPLERKAQLLATQIRRGIERDNPDMDEDDKKKKKNQALSYARARVGANKQQIQITEKEWKAIQAGALSDSQLREVLNNANMDQVRAYATPRDTTKLSSADLALAKSMMAADYTRAEIADRLGVSRSTLSNALNEK